MFDKNLALCEEKEPSKIKYCGIGYGADFFDVDGRRYPCPFCTPMTFSQVELEKMAKTEFDKDENFVDEDCYNNCYLCDLELVNLFDNENFRTDLFSAHRLF